MAAHPAHLPTGDGHNDASRRPSVLGLGRGEHARGRWGAHGPEEAADSAAGLSAQLLRPASRRGHGRQKGSLRAAISAVAVLALATVGTAASPRHSAFVSPSTGFMPSRLSSSLPLGACARPLRCAPTSPLHLMEMKRDVPGDKMKKIARKRLLGSRRLARALAALLIPPERLEEDDAKVLWSRRIALAVESFSTDPASLAASSSSSSANYFPTTGAASLPPSYSSPTVAPLPLQAAITPETGSSAFSQPAEPRTATSTSIADALAAGKGGDAGVRKGPPLLPELSAGDLVQLGEGQRVQRQTRSGRVGTGMVVVDVCADVGTCLSVLTDVDRYPERIKTVREAITYECGDRLRKTQFQLSRFRLQINTELRCEKERNLLSFKMDPQRPAPFLNQADGFWHLQAQVLPTAIVDYAAARALPRATKWLRPVMEEMASSLPPLSPMCESECEVLFPDRVR
ncbi:hypothetical protein T484DRAFT_1975585 [Baffinella frigidus]|nr:hypothetical protein T484DRAFT_1975585 [Cryptophyta sp. CCMP2293]